MFKESKEIILKKLDSSMKIIFFGVKNSNKEDKLIKENQMDCLELKRMEVTENFTGGASISFSELL